MAERTAPVAVEAVTVITTSTPEALSHEMSSPLFEEQPPPRLKGRKRLLASLQRISSSQSIGGRSGSSRSRGYSGSGRGSISCISLNTSMAMGGYPLGHSLTQELAVGSATAPVSAVNTPGIQIPLLDERARVRYVSNLESKTSVGLPAEVRVGAIPSTTPGIAEVDEDYFSRPTEKRPVVAVRDFNFWRDLPSELRMEVLTYLDPREVVRCSIVSKAWHAMCFDGQLWSNMDTAGFYQEIPGDRLASIIAAAGPFVRDLNLRGCVQLKDRWSANGLSDACTNLENMSLEGCCISRTSIHNFLWANSRLVHLNLSGLEGATDAAMAIIAANCPKIEHLNVSWCKHVTTTGLHKIMDSCPNLTDLRAGQGKGWDNIEFMETLFHKNQLERLVLMNCDNLTDEALAVLMEGRDSEMDYLTGRPIVPPRKLKHLDLTKCWGISDVGLRTMVNNIPEIEGLQLSKCRRVFDTTLVELLPTTPLLTHLDLEELDDLTNVFLNTLANSACAKRLRHLSVSFCENISDVGMIPVVQACTNLRSLEMDNTRIGDLVLAEAAAMVRKRSPRLTVQGVYQPGSAQFLPASGLRLVAYDCQNVTWTGVREVLSRNADVTITTHTTQLPPLEKTTPAPASVPSSSSATSSAENLPAAAPQRSPSPRIHIVRSTIFPAEVIQLKCFYTYQPTVEEHTKRVMRGDFMAARRLERKWAEFMMAQEEAGAGGAGSRRRRRRAREAQMMHADEEDVNAAGSGVGGGRRRRARSGGCSVM